jgi:hypothetical protein
MPSPAAGPLHGGPICVQRPSWAITAYFTTHTYTAEALPPGIVRKLARGKPLPPGIAKRSLPRDLVATLPTRDGFEITIFGDRIVLLEASGLVVDILQEIFD